MFLVRPLHAPAPRRTWKPESMRRAACVTPSSKGSWELFLILSLWWRLQTVIGSGLHRLRQVDNTLLMTHGSRCRQGGHEDNRLTDKHRHSWSLCQGDTRKCQPEDSENLLLLRVRETNGGGGQQESHHQRTITFREGVCVWNPLQMETRGSSSHLPWAAPAALVGARAQGCPPLCSSFYSFPHDPSLTLLVTCTFHTDAFLHVICSLVA